MGWIENRPNKFLNQNFVRQGLSAKCKTGHFRFISLIWCDIRCKYMASISTHNCGDAKTRSTRNGWMRSGSTVEWLYGLRNAKLCVLQNTQSGPPSRRRAPCILVALPAAYEAKKIPGYVCILRIEKREINPKPNPPSPPPLPSPLADSRPQPLPNIVPVSAISPPRRCRSSGSTLHQRCAALSKAVLVGLVVSARQRQKDQCA
jgi:hypothetical protein